MTTTLNTSASLESLREFADLEPYFALLDAGEYSPASIVAEALFHDGEELAITFAIALLRERMGIELREGEELSELSIIELLDPAKGVPTLETRAYAALVALSMPYTTADERRNNAYLASYLTEHEIGLGLVVSLNTMRASYGFGPTGW